MGIWFSFPSQTTNEAVAKVSPEVQRDPEMKILIRHRPTCLSTDLEAGISEVAENAVAVDTKTD
jgi:hypothetical protein